MSLTLLPPELRHNIFSKADIPDLRNRDPDLVYLRVKRGKLHSRHKPPLSLFLTCRNIGEEAQHAWYSTKTFLVTSDFDHKPLLLYLSFWLKAIGPMNLKSLRNLELLVRFEDRLQESYKREERVRLEYFISEAYADDGSDYNSDVDLEMDIKALDAPVTATQAEEMVDFILGPDGPGIDLLYFPLRECFRLLSNSPKVTLVLTNAAHGVSDFLDVPRTNIFAGEIAHLNRLYEANVQVLWNIECQETEFMKIAAAKVWKFVCEKGRAKYGLEDDSPFYITCLLEYVPGGV